VLSDFADGTTLSAKGGRTSILAETVLTALHTLGIPTAVAGTPGSARMTIRAAHDLVIVISVRSFVVISVGSQGS
jgi:DNA-binding MurR/RpiR family transcriptional regulator